MSSYLALVVVIVVLGIVALVVFIPWYVYNLFQPAFELAIIWISMVLGEFRARILIVK